jgi:hypothetical protein
VLLFATNIKSLILRNHIIWSALEFIVTFSGDCLSQFFLKLSLSLPNLIFHLLVFLFSFLWILYLHLKHGSTDFKTAISFIFSLTIAWLLLLLNDFLYLLKLCFDVRSQFTHFEWRYNMPFNYSFYTEFIVFKIIDVVIF